MNKSSYLAKEKFLRQIKEEFVCKLDNFMADVSPYTYWMMNCTSKKNFSNAIAEHKVEYRRNFWLTWAKLK